jgi:toxin ParE1/3/4
VKFKIHPGASAEVAKQAIWYDSRRDGLGDEFLAAVDDAFDLIEEAPLRWPLWPGFEPAHRVLLTRFPFAVAYVVRADSVFVLAVPHTHSEPGQWFNRLNKTP